MRSVTRPSFPLAYLGRVLGLLSLLALLPPSVSAQSPGDVDSLNLGISGSEVMVTAVQPDGKMILAGTFTQVLGGARNNIARVNADGTLDTGFDPNVNGAVYTVAVQADGKVLLGGNFSTLSPNGGAAVTRYNIARVNADGTLDTSFDPNANSTVNTVVVQADGKVLLGGNFTALSTNGGASVARYSIARVNADGTLDTGFNPNADNAVRSLVVQADGKVLLGGNFTTLSPNGGASVTRNRIARVNADGTLDTGFNPNASNVVRSLAVQADGKVLLGGDFTTLSPNGGASVTRYYIARVNADGTLDTGFDPNPNATVHCVVVQADGRVLLGGGFVILSPNGGAVVTRGTVARMNADGSLDTGFNPNANGGGGSATYSVAVQTDGKVLLGGSFSTLSPNGGAAVPRNRFARLYNDATTQTLAATSPTQADWQRGGAGPELEQVSFALSTDGGTNYSALPGTATRVGTTANWRLTGLSLPASGHLRARGRTSGGFQNGSSGLIEQVLAFSGLVTVPTVTNISPTSGSTTGGTSVTITGTNFSGTPIVTIGGVPATSVVVVDATTITCTTPPGTGTAKDVVVTISGTPSTGGTGLFSYNAPTITGISPTTGSTAGGTSVTITGTNFGGTPTVTIGGNPASSVVVVDATTITAVTPAGTAGARDVVVTVSGQSSTGGTGIYTYLAPPVVALNGANLLSNAVTMTINGSGFSNTPGNNTVVFSPSGTGTVTASGFFQLTVSGITGLTAGPLYAVVTTNGLSSGAPVQVRTVVTPVAGDPLPFNAQVVSGGGIISSATQPDGKIIIAGLFTSVGGVPRTNIARLNADGTLDAGFNPVPNAQVTSVLVQPDGKILMGGNFTQVNGQARTYLARLAADGTLEGYNPPIDNAVHSLTAQADGAVIIAGSFTNFTGAARAGLARIDQYYGFDSSFNPNADGTVESVVVEPDGDILLGGSFFNVGGTARQYMARVSSTGVLDTSFTPTSNLPVTCMELQADGKIVVGGHFTQMNGVTRNNFARLNADGTLDTGFNPQGNGAPYDIAVQADGKILFAGDFTAIAATVRNRVARVNADGSLDTGFNPNVGNMVYNVSLQSNGSVLIAGAFGDVGGYLRSNLALLLNDTATQTLVADSASQITWTRSGAAPDVSRVTFERSGDGGSTWTTLGNGSRVGTTSNYQLTGLSLPATGQIRARGRTNSGWRSASASLIEQVASYSVTPPNTAPTDITLTPSSIAENNAANATVGTLAAVDADSGQTHTFTKVTGTGDTDNASFSISGTDLILIPSANFEVKSSYSVRVQADDGNGGTFAKAFTVTVTNVNEVPTLAAISKSGTEDTTVTFTAADFTSAFSDPDSDALSSITVVTLPATGALKLSGSNVAVSQVIPAANLGNLTYVPAADENGAKTFTLTASDGSLSSSPATTVTMTLTAVNDAPSFALSASPSFDPNWVQQTSPTLQWTASASSADGMKLVAAAWPGNIYTSADRGVTWTQRASTQTWAGLASSSDGTKLVACAAIYQGAQIYTSADSGVTWTARPSAGSRDWTQVASSADGTKLVACVWNGGVYTSTDSGANWTLRSAAGTRNWSCVASSADGTKLAATSWQGNIYTSDDSGATWSARDSVRTWWTVTMSADGTKLGAGLVDGGGPIYISTDSGATWTPSNSGNINFGSISCSEDFSTVVAVGNGSGSRVYISYDSGVNWVIAPNSPVGSGESISISADGSTIVYPMHNGTGGKIYTTINEAILTVNEDSGASSRANFAASISAGPANESAQTVSFTVTNDNNALFSVQPAIDAGGALTFTPAANANGSAIVSVTAVDSGSGTAPNVNSSAAQTFTLTVTPVNDAPVITSNGGGATDSLNIAENTTAVTTAVAIDSDLPAQTVTYSKSGTHAALFNIGSSTGVLTFASAPDFETNPGPFSVTVTATDNGSPNLSDTQDLTINVTDVNEAPTAISGGAGGASGVISWSPINTFNDNPSQVLTNGTRHAAVCFAGLDLTVNGVVFDRWIGSGVFGNASKISLPIDVFTGNYASGGSGTYGSMLSRGGFHYMANPYFDITGLTPGSTYQVQIFMPFWDQLYPTLFGSTGGSSVTLQCGKPASPHPAPDVLVGTFTASGTTQRVLWGSTAPALLGAVSVRSLPSLVVPENNTPNATIETFAAADQDAGSTHAFTLVSGTGSDDNGAFTLSTSGLLTINSSTDFETKSSYAIRIRATDTGGLFVEQAFVVTVTNVNEAVLALALTGSSVNENAAVNTTVGTLSSTDTDLADTHTYALVTGTGDTDNASFNISGSALRTSAALDYEAGTTRSIRVRTTDAGGLFFEQAFTITVANVNETPTDIALSSNTTPENVAANSTIGTLSTTDPDAGNTFTYSLVSGTGSTDNASFNISSNALRITASPNFEAKSSYAVRVRSTDQGGLFFEKAFTISISDVNEVPTAITFTGGAPAGTLYASGLTARMVYSSGSITGLAYADGMLLNGTNVASEYSGPISYVDFADYNTAGRFPGVLPFPGRASLTDFNQAVLQVTGTITVPTNGTYTFAVRSDDGSRIKIDGITVFSDDTFHGENEYYTPVNLTAGTHSLDFVFFEGGGGAQVELFVATGSYTSYNGSFGLLRAYPVSVAENNAIGAAVGTLAATDPDGGSSHTFELVSGTGDTDNASFTLSPAGALSINISTDYEVKSSYSIRVRATDNGTPGLSFEQTAIVSVTNVNEGPTTLALTGSSVNENAAANTTVGTLSTTDPDAADTFTYTLVSGTGSTDNASFNISGSTLRANAGIDFEAGATRSIRVRTTDAGGLFAEDSFTITINNVNEIPSFVKGGDQRHPYQTSGSQSVTSWATSMSDGDSTVVQALSFNTSNNANGMFSVQPAVSSAGDLTYTLSGTSGVATVSVSITDDNTINGNAALTSAVQTFTITVDPQPDYTVTTTATTIALTNVTNTSDTLSFTNGGTSGVFAATGRTFSLNGGLNQSDSISLTYASYPGINSIVIDGAGGNDTINVGDFSALPGFAGLTIHGGAGDDTVNFNGDISFDADLNLDVDLQNDHATPGTDTVNVAANANLATSGNGAISVKASRNIAMASGSSFATVNGALTLEANQQIVPTTGDFLGLHSDGGQISASGTGVVTVKSRAGDGMTNTYGIFLENGAGISGGTIGTVLVEGTGGAGSGDFNIGVNVRNSSITSAGADTVVNGTGGGTGASSGNWGVNVEVVGSITAGGSGTVSVTGQGGNSGGTGGNNYGVHVRFLGSVTSSGGAVSVTGTAGGGAGDFNIGVNVSSGSITSLGGNVSVAGTAAGTGVSANNWGVNIEHSGEITAGGSGTVTIAGIGGNTTGTGGSNYGVLLRHSGVATSSGGALSVTGTGGGSSGASDNLGINVTLSSSITTAANGGTNTITADSMNFDGTAVISAGPSGTVVLRQKSNLTAIDLGSVSDSVIGTLELSDAELDRITADVLTIGKAAAGNLTVSAALSPANVTTLNLVSGGTIADTNTSGADITVASLTTAGTLAPGASPGLFSVAGNHSIVSGSAYNVELGGLTAGTLHDQLNVAGTVTIGTGVTLNVSTISAFEPQPGDEFVLVSNDGSDAVSGTFNGLPEGANILLGTLSTVLTYTGGDGNDIVLRRPAIIPIFLGSTGSTGGGSGSGTIDAPNEDATASLGKWESIRQGAVISSNGHIAFRGHLELGTGSTPVTVDDFQGIWRYDGTNTRLKARSGSAAPEAGGALYDMLPLNPAISPDGLITFYGTLRMGTGTPATTASTYYGLWSEIGGGGSVRLLLREGDVIVSGKTFRSGFAVSGSSANTAALNVKLSSGSALLHLDVNTPSVLLTVVAEEGQTAPGGGTWVALDGNSSDPRLSANGDLGFIGWEKVGNSQIQGIYSRLNSTAVGTSGAVVQARMGGTAPGTSGATFSAFERPTVYNGGMAFRGFLNANGDNAGGTKGQGVWAGAFGSLLPVVRTGDTTAQIPTVPAGRTVSSVWSPFSNALGSLTMRVSLVGGGETRAIMGSTGGTMRVIAKAGDAAPGLVGETFTNFDHPVIGDGDQVAFTASTNAGNYGIWKQALGGGSLSLVMKTGDTISTSEGDKTVSEISLPGATTDDRKFEARCMDAIGRLLIHVTFADGTSSLLLGQ